MSKSKRRYWSQAEMEYLKKSYPDVRVSLEEMATHLNMKVSDVYRKAAYHFIQRNDGVPVNKTSWSKSDISFIKKNFHSLTNPAMARKLGKTLTVVRNKCRELGLLHMELEYWTPDQVEFLKSNFRTIGNVDLAKMFQERWPKKKPWTLKHIEKKKGYLGLKRTIEEQFLLRTHRYNPEDYKDFNGKNFPQGKKRIWISNGVSRMMIKVGNSFRPLHIYKWEKLRGEIPKGMKLHFLDGNTLNCSIKNLELLTKSELARKISIRNHMNMSDSYIAGLLAHNWHSKVDKDLKRQFLQMPELLATKRLQLKINRQNKSL